MTSIVDYTDRAINTIAERIENSLGGNVDIVKNNKEETFTVDWKRNDKTVHAVQFKKVYSYKELEKLSDPGALVMDFITAFTKPKEVKPLKVEIVETEAPKVVETEAPKVVKAKTQK